MAPAAFTGLGTEIVPMLPRTCLLVSILAASVISVASVQTALTHPAHSNLGNREHQLWKTPARITEYSEIPHVSERFRCADTQAPEALTTPDPFFFAATTEMKVKVSFIIGTDGRVHSPLILQSGGWLGDRDVLRTVRTWRYRPARCNGVPTEAEGKVEFSRY
jgi:TonB family protein